MNVLMPHAIPWKDLSSLQQFQVYVFFADSLFYEKHYFKAENIYRKALDVRKSLYKNRKKSQTCLSEVGNEVELKYQLYMCAINQQDLTKSLIALESIPVKQRTAKINIALGDLYMRNKSDNNAISCFREVLKENPLSLRIITNLIKLGMKTNEIINIVMGSSVASSIDWLPIWIRAKSLLYSSEVSQSVTLFQELLDKPSFKENPEIMSCLGQALYYSGEYKKAISVFKKVYSNEHYSYNGLDIYGSCLAKENQLKELEVLANKFLPICETGEKSPEPWIVLAYYSFLANKKEAKSAIYFSQKACVLSGNSTESLLLKGSILMEGRNHSEAVGYFSDALHNSPYSFEALKCLAEAYLADNRKTQAVSIANQAFRHIGQTPRTLTLLASVLLAEPEKQSNKKNAKVSLEKAVRLDSSYLPAVYLLANICIEEKNTDKAIEILNKALEFESSNKLHRMLGDCYTDKNEHEKALHHHNIASKLEVNYRSSTEASQRLEQQTTRGVNAESLDIDEVQESDNDVDESETDVVWSDADS
ncbi:Anaphase-promoting complex subunit 7-like protein [Leptotrombidium deliense]|uniref:Anaphase-promoting complex subunit 7-like protein n=1 Tax=Leptotrombidium deliense TaxID=299467 RepID=A0A443SN28_9ACAR|nr:Anaphase-promoting complex subunit 7-like protein [Leptotrombidium deliense]